MKISRFTVNTFGENTYILWDEGSHEAAIIDPGMISQNEIDAVDNFIEKNGLKPTHLLFTHLHLDHAFGANHIKTKYNLKVEASAAEQRLGEMIPLQAKKFGIAGKYEPITIDTTLNEGDTIRIGDEELHVILVPGHSPGGIVFYSAESNFIIPGDVLFCGSIGRTDLEGGNYHGLVEGIKNKLLILPDETLVCPGHGDSTTIGDEKFYNTYLR